LIIHDEAILYTVDVGEAKIVPKFQCELAPKKSRAMRVCAPIAGARKIRSPCKLTSSLPKALLSSFPFSPATGNVDQIKRHTQQENVRSAQKETLSPLYPRSPNPESTD
jgi:hypothetical protein